jgi:hypothetical protein
VSDFIYFDSVIRVFESSGNLHIVGGCVTGEIDPAGNDLVQKVAHFVMPMKCAVSIIPDIAKSLPLLENPESERTTTSVNENDDSFEGAAIYVKLA